MATNLAGGGVELGQHSACILRAAVLGSNCAPLGGADSGLVTGGIITMQASAEIEEGQRFEPKTGCGDIGFVFAKNDRVKWRNVSGDLLFADPEMKKILFGGKVITGNAGTGFAGLNSGWAELDFSDPDPPAVYLEVITRLVSRQAGECSPSGAAVPYARGYVFGRCKLTLGDATFENDVFNLSFTGTAFSNPALYNGPWNDWPGLTNGSPYIPNSPMVDIMYSTTEYNAILATVGAGYKTLPAAS